MNLIRSMKGTRRRTQKGSVTVEAAISLPIFICMIVTLLSIIKVVYVTDAISHAISETADHVASIAYPAYALGYRTDRALTSPDEFIEESGQTLLLKCLGLLEGKSEDTSSILPEILGTLVNSQLQEGAEDIFLQTVISIYMPEMISGTGIENVDDKLRGLGVVGGYEGLDFSSSSLGGNGSEDVVIAVEYCVDIPVPIKLFRPVRIKQSAAARLWMGGDEPSEVEEEDIWSLSNLQRGTRVHKIFKSNLPWFFPGLSYFQSGTAKLIRSMDLTAASYAEPENIERTVCGYIDDLAEYNGQPIPWGKEGIVIKPNDIAQRELLLVIPRNPFPEEANAALQRCRNYADRNSVILIIEKYGTKKTEEKTE